MKTPQNGLSGRRSLWRYHAAFLLFVMPQRRTATALSRYEDNLEPKSFFSIIVYGKAKRYTIAQ